MKEYFRFFKIPFIIVGVLAVITLLLVLVNKGQSVSTSVSANTERMTTERVFDYADRLTDDEEEALRDLIQDAEKDTKCDIVIVTLNESLVEYAAQYEDIIGPVSTDQCVMVYADNFYDEHKFGYDEAYGDGVLFLDNVYREADGGVYSWMSTTGRAEDRFSSFMIDDVLDEVFYYIEDDSYQAYAAFVKEFRKKMISGNDNEMDAVLQSPYVPLISSLVIAAVFMIINWSSKKGKRTTTDRTYVVGGNPSFRRREDRFLYKNVTKRKIEKSSSSGSGGGGGGHHRSASGRSHGGGGRRR